MSYTDQDIPTLTDFIRIGDEDMHHHFDAQQFSINQDDSWASTDTFTSDEDAFSTDGIHDIDLALNQPDNHTNNSQSQEPENETGAAKAEITGSDSTEFDPPHIAAVEVDQIPAELAPFEPALVEGDTSTDEASEYLELGVEEVISADTPPMQMNTESVVQEHVATAENIRQQIDLAVDELVPDIAEQLKQHLYRHFKCQADTD